MPNEPRYPETSGKSLENQVRDLQDYTINLQRYVRWALRNIGTKNMDRVTADAFRNIKGAVTFEDLIGEGTTEINGSNITSGTINAELINLVETSGAGDSANAINHFKLQSGRIEIQEFYEDDVGGDVGKIVLAGGRADFYSSYSVGGELTGTDELQVRIGIDHNHSPYNKVLFYGIDGSGDDGVIASIGKEGTDDADIIQLLADNTTLSLQANGNYGSVDIYGQNGVTIGTQDSLGNVRINGQVSLSSALPVTSGGTGKTSFTSGYFLTGNSKSIQEISPSAALSKIGAQKEMAFATASTTVSQTTGGKDIPLQTFLGTSTSVFTNARYNSSYGYGIKCIKAGKYLISATANLQLNTSSTSGTTVTVAIRKVVGGTSTYIVKGNHTFSASSSGHAITLTLVPQVVTLEANSYLSLYNALSTVVTKAEGCWITAVYLGS